jgi:hypothetical protein
VGGPVAGRRRVQVVPPVRIDRLVGLLRVEAFAREVDVAEPRRELVAPDGLHGRPRDEELAPPMRRREDDRLRRDLGLEDRRHGLRVPGQLRPPPLELRRVERRQVHHRHVDAAALVHELRPQRLGEALERVLRAAVRRLERDSPVRERGPDLDDRAAVPGPHPAEGGEGAVDRAEVRDLRRAGELVRIDLPGRRVDGRHRVVDPDVDRAELGLDTRRSILDRGRVGHVDG